MRLCACKWFLAVALGAGLCPLASFGQKHQAEPKPNHPAPAPPRANRPDGKTPRPNAPQARPNHPNIAMPDAIARWDAMKPDVREQALAKLPPEQQQRLRDRIAAFNRLPKEEQQRQTDRPERFSRPPSDHEQ